MHFTLRFAVVGSMALMLAGCGGAHVVERPSGAAPAPIAEPAANTEAAPINTPPKLPPNYKQRLAAALALEYARFGNGTPIISEPESRSGLVAGNTSVCVKYPMKYPLATSDLTHAFRVSISQGLFQDSTLAKQRALGPWEKCEGSFSTFVELIEVDRKIKACRAAGQSRCVVNEEPNRKDTIVLPSSML